MEGFAFASDFKIYDNPYFIMLFFAVMFGFFIFILIKTDNNESQRQNDTNIKKPIQKYTANTDNSIQEHTSIKDESIQKYTPNKDESVHKNTSEKNEAFEIIKIRYAKGEINEEEFEKIKKAVT